MKTKWTDCSALQDLAAAQARGDDQDIIIRLRSRFMDTKNMICCALEHEAAAEIESLRQQLETARRLVEHRQDALASCMRADDEKSRVIKQFKADTERYRWLIDNSFDRHCGREDRTGHEGQGPERVHRQQPHFRHA